MNYFKCPAEEPEGSSPAFFSYIAFSVPRELDQDGNTRQAGRSTTPTLPVVFSKAALLLRFCVGVAVWVAGWVSITHPPQDFIFAVAFLKFFLKGVDFFCGLLYNYVGCFKLTFFVHTLFTFLIWSVRRSGIVFSLGGSMDSVVINPTLCYPDHKAGFAAHVDWYSGMLYNYSVGAVLDLLGYDYSTLYSILSDDKVVRQHSIFSSGIYNTLQGYHFHYNGLSLTVAESDYLSSMSDFAELIKVSDIDPDSLGIFDVVFSKMRLELSGSAIDFLRVHCFPDIDSKLFDIDFFTSTGFFSDTFVYRSSKVTRIDCAFDFINYADSFFENYYTYCLKLMTVSGTKMPIQGLTKRCVSSFSLKCGDSERTIYSGTGARILRCYDKKLQVCDKNGVVQSHLPSFLDEFRYQLHSWFRLELQVRNEYAHSVICSFDSVEESWRYILDHCCPLVEDEKGEFDKAWFFVELLDQQKIESIKLNAHLVEYDIGKKLDYSTVSSSLLQRAKACILAIYRSGFSGLLDLLDSYLALFDDPDKLKYILSDISEFAENENIPPERFRRVFVDDRFGLRLNRESLYRYLSFNVEDLI